MPASRFSSLSWKRLIPILIFLALVVGLGILLFLLGRDPFVLDIEPAVVREGSRLEIRGRFFGDTPGRVRIAGTQVPSSSVREWSDRRIVLSVPAGTDSGLLFVETDGGASRGTLLQMERSVPRSDAPSYAPGSPEVFALGSDTVRIGDILVLEGRNFGRQRRNSRVLFAASTDSGHISPEPADISYPGWSENEIRVRVPSDAESGFVVVDTAWGRSNPMRLSIDRPSGRLIRGSRTEIAIRYGARVGEVVLAEDRTRAPGDSDVVVWLPAISSTPRQTGIRYVAPVSVISANSANGAVTRIRYESVGDGFRANPVQTVVANRYETTLEADPSRISPSYESESGFFSYYTAPGSLLPTRAEALISVAAQIRSGRASPYQIARAAYDWLLETMEFALYAADRSAIAGLEQGYGDDFTYATLYVSLLRASLIPARIVSGVIVSGDGYAYPHYWAEFFVPAIGWIPADPALGDLGFPAAFPRPEDPREYYFGNLDSNRLAFLRGFAEDGPDRRDGSHFTPEDALTYQRRYIEAGKGIAEFHGEWLAPQLVGFRQW